MATHTKNGKAFEYAIAIAFARYTEAPIEENSAYKIAKASYENYPENKRYWLDRASDEATVFLCTHDTSLDGAKSICLQDDGVGIRGDVRDVVIDTKSVQIGISAKHNHEAIKHSRLSDRIDFGKEWADYPCSQTYWGIVKPLFTDLRQKSKEGLLFEDLSNKEADYYKPILNAFGNEMRCLCENHRRLFVERMFKYLLGRYDFYKVVLSLSKKSVHIQSVNINNTLKYGNKWPIPNEIEAIEWRKNEDHTDKGNEIVVRFCNGWQISFRIHNAEKKVVPSFKFDINFLGVWSGVTAHTIDLQLDEKRDV